MSHPSAARKAFDGPAIYSIAVQGTIGEDWCDRLGGMVITAFIPESGSPVTTLVGELRDQASLSGVLDTLYELHLPVISVQRLAFGS
jgi:hypothetical protein